MIKYCLRMEIRVAHNYYTRNNKDILKTALNVLQVQQILHYFILYIVSKHFSFLLLFVLLDVIYPAFIPFN